MESMKYRINKADYKIIAGCNALDDQHFRRRYWRMTFKETAGQTNSMATAGHFFPPNFMTRRWRSRLRKILMWKLLFKHCHSVENKELCFIVTELDEPYDCVQFDI
jgi:hypothetical protein